MNKPLSDRITCWNFVIDELKLGTALPATRPSTEIGRATSGAAHAYLGFAYLTRAYEESAQETQHLADALTALNAVTGYELVSGDALIDMFNGRNKNCKNPSLKCSTAAILITEHVTIRGFTTSSLPVNWVVGMKYCPTTS